MSNKCKVVTLIIVSLIVLSEAGTDPDRVYSPQRAFTSAVSYSLGGTGVALPHAAGFYLNPALLFSYRKDLTQAHGSIFTGYGRDSVFGRHIAEVGAGYAENNAAIGAFYRYLGSNEERNDHEVILNYSGQLFEKSSDQGAVDIGVNLRIEKQTWAKNDLNPLYTYISYYDTTRTTHLKKDSLVDSSGTVSGKVLESRWIADIGFFQTNVTPNIDFGLVLKNAFGYRWTRETPDTAHSADSIGMLGKDTIILKDSASYNSQYAKSTGWLEGKYRSLIVGFTYHTKEINENLELTLPVDIEVLGLFDKKIKNRFAFHGGVQVKIRNAYYLRAGYARAPGTIKAGDVKIPNVNIFVGGAGVTLAPVTIDFYIGLNSWGLNTSLDF